MASGDYSAASKIVNDRIQDIQDENKRDLDILKTAYEFVGDDMTEKEKSIADKAFKTLFQSRQFEQEKEITKYRAEIEDNQLALKLRNDILKKYAGKGVTGLGNLTTDQLISYQFQQSDPLNWDELLKNPRLAFQKLNPEQLGRFKDYMELESEMTAEQKEEDKQAESIRNGALTIYEMADSLLSDDLRSGLKDSVGPIFFTRTNYSPLNNATVNKFRAQFKNLLSKEVLKYYADIKQAGVTFGALSEKELDLINQAATGAFGGIYDGEGKFEGRSNLKEKDFIELLEATRSASQKTFILSARGASGKLGGVLRNMSAEAVNELFMELRDNPPELEGSSFSDDELKY